MKKDLARMSLETEEEYFVESDNLRAILVIVFYSLHDTAKLMIKSIEL
jgi:hypothetical protein